MTYAEMVVGFLNALLMIVLPLVLGYALRCRWRLDWRVFVAGMLTFIGAQVLHLPFNHFILRPILAGFGLSVTGGVLLLGLIALCYGLSAGLFEETARYVTLAWPLKRTRGWRQALMFGAGHGGIEAILLGMTALAFIIQLLGLQNADPNTLSEAMRKTVESYQALPLSQRLLGSLERLCTLGVHLSLSVMVMQVFARRRRVWLALAIGWHTLVDAVSVFSHRLWGVMTSEMLLAGMALLSLWIIYALRPRSEDA